MEESFNQRLILAMQEMENPKKEKDGYNYKYETLEQILNTVRPALLKHGFLLIQGMKWHEPTESFVLETGICDENETRILDVRHIPNFSDAQQAGSWETYMRRYSLRTAFGLTGEDDDGAATLDKPVSTGKPMTEKQNNLLMGLVGQLGELRGVGNDEVINALMKSKPMQGATFETLTSKQASEAINQLLAWKDQAGLAKEEFVF